MTNWKTYSRKTSRLFLTVKAVLWVISSHLKNICTTMLTALYSCLKFSAITWGWWTKLLFWHKTIQIVRIERCGNCSLNSCLDEKDQIAANLTLVWWKRRMAGHPRAFIWVVHVAMHFGKGQKWCSALWLNANI